MKWSTTSQTGHGTGGTHPSSQDGPDHRTSGLVESVRDASLLKTPLFHRPDRTAPFFFVVVVVFQPRLHSDHVRQERRRVSVHRCSLIQSYVWKCVCVCLCVTLGYSPSLPTVCLTLSLSSQAVFWSLASGAVQADVDSCSWLRSGP